MKFLQRWVIVSGRDDRIQKIFVEFNSFIIKKNLRNYEMTSVTEQNKWSLF